MSKALRRTGIVLGAIAGVLLLTAGLLYTLGSSKLNRVYEAETAELNVSTDSATVARGAHLANTQGCTDCHTPTLGGQIMGDDPPFLLVASNLTSGRGGVGSRYSPADFDRAIRHGLRPDGRSLLVMPSAAYNHLSDQDAAAIIAYIMSVPPVDNDLPRTRVRPLGRMMAAVVLDPSFEVRTARARQTAPPEGDGAEYGAYLASVTCAYCHGSDLRGNDAPPGPPGAKPAPDLVAAAGRWSFEQFDHVLKTGERPDAPPVDSVRMPISITASMQDQERRALYAHLREGAGRQ